MARMAIMEIPDGALDAGAVMGTPIIADDSVQFGDKFTIPHGMTYEQAILTLQRKMQDEETEMNFRRQYSFRPNDGAVATIRVLREVFGITRSLPQGWFGMEPPEMKTIAISATETMQVPWGNLQIPDLEDAQLTTQAFRHKEYGVCFAVTITAKRKYKERIDALLDLIGEQLKKHSIYRGKALIGHGEPEFLNMDDFDPTRVVYSQDVMTALDASVWGVLKYTEAMRRDGISRKRAVLMHGPYGTGKTLGGQLTADIATKNGWTFIAAKPGQEDLTEAMNTAKLYEPAVVFFEDVDETASTPDREEMSKLMEVFDGITAKGGEILALMTTNHLDRIAKPMLRPGRLDALIEVGHLDRPGIEKLVKVVVAPGKLKDDIDYDKVHEAMDGFYPAFISEVCNRASSVALTRTKGAPTYKLATEDLVAAAITLRPQLDTMREAGEGRKKAQLDMVLQERIKEGTEDAVAGASFRDYDDDHVGKLVLANGKGR